MPDRETMFKWRILPRSRGEGVRLGGETPLQQRSRDRRRDNPRRALYQKFYNSMQWRRLRKAILERDPLCAYCGELATEVDHITPHRLVPALMWDPANLCGVCSPCHRRKSALGM